MNRAAWIRRSEGVDFCPAIHEKSHHNRVQDRYGPIRMDDRVAYRRCLLTDQFARDYESEEKAARGTIGSTSGLVDLWACQPSRCGMSKKPSSDFLSELRVVKDEHAVLWIL
jgi:hypothetical protein